MKGIVLAAGYGSRMGALTQERPKPMLEVGGDPLVVYQLRRLADAGVTEVIINIAQHGACIRAGIGTGAAWGLKVTYSDEGEVPLETGGGIQRALPLLGTSPFYVVNADVMTDFDLRALHLDSNAEGMLMLVDNPEHHREGDFALDDAGCLGASGRRLTYGGIALLAPALFASYAPGPQPLRPILDAAIARHTLRGVHHRGRWADVGTPERLASVRRESW